MTLSLEQKTAKYRLLTQAGLEQIQFATNLSLEQKKIAADFLQMAQNYYNDAKHFEETGDHATALAAYSYAHAWLDAGVRAGVFDARGNDRLFTVK
ncbi:MAG: DUF357 domain-containing protein [Candidatus Diapherotrites archaeon]|nr:DUF357 domain-containing protein [Candidatus Diapherotrites archaeon]